MELKFKKLNKNAKTPTYGTTGSACFDFYLPNIKVIYGCSNKIGLGIAVEVPEGYALLIVPRSSTGLHTTLRQSNSIGIIDSDYRGEICVLLDNLNAFENKWLTQGERIAQGFVVPIPKVEFVEVDELGYTYRGVGGFGSTGRT